MITTHAQQLEKENSSPAGLRVPGDLAKWPIFGFSMMVLGGLIFGVFVYNFQNQGPLLKWDVPLANYLHNVALNSSVIVVDLMIAGFYIGKQVVTTIVSILILYFLYKRFWRELAMVAIGVGGAGIVWLILSRYFDRPRPAFAHPIWIVLKEGGFPSGHTITAVVSYGFLAYLLSSRLSSRMGKWMVYAIAIGIMLFIGFSRLFMGDHYLSDVLAGYALGIFWAGLVYTSIEIFYEKRSSSHVRQG